jgi:hypothetical protein
MEVKKRDGCFASTVVDSGFRILRSRVNCDVPVDIAADSRINFTIKRIEGPCNNGGVARPEEHIAERDSKTVERQQKSCMGFAKNSVRLFKLEASNPLDLPPFSFLKESKLTSLKTATNMRDFTRYMSKTDNAANLRQNNVRTP